MSRDRRTALSRDGVSLSRLVFGVWRLLNGAVHMPMQLPG
jgi:predicted oxidoreductase